MAEFNLLDIVDLLERADNTGIKVVLDNDELVVQVHRDKKVDPFLLSELKAHKDSLIQYFKRNQLTGDAGHSHKISDHAFNKRDTDRIPLSYSQERLWFIHRLEGSLAYNLSSVL